MQFPLGPSDTFNGIPWKDFCEACRAKMDGALRDGSKSAMICTDCAALLVERGFATKVGEHVIGRTTGRLVEAPVDEPSPGHPAPWRWGTNGDDWLRAANGEIVISAGDGCTWPANPYVGELVRAAPEMEALLRELFPYFDPLSDDIDPGLGLLLTNALFLVKRIDAAKAG